MTYLLEFDAFSEAQTNELTVTLNGQTVAVIGRGIINQWAHYGPYDVTSIVQVGATNQLMFAQIPNSYNPIQNIDFYEVLNNVRSNIFTFAGPQTVYGKYTGPANCLANGCPAIFAFSVVNLVILSVLASVVGLPVTVTGGSSASGPTPFAVLVVPGTYTVAVPQSVVVGGQNYVFQHWQDGTTNPSILVNVTATMTLTATYLAATLVATTLTMVLNNQNYLAGQPIQIMGILSGGGAGLPGEPVQLLLDGTATATATTAADGSYLFTVDSSSLAPGPHTVETMFQGASIIGYITVG